MARPLRLDRCFLVALGNLTPCEPSVSSPGFPWERLRKESAEVYESYVDLEPGAWTKLKIVVSGVRASLFVNGANQPCLIVNDLKLGKTRGQIALWIGQDTNGYFSNLTVR